MGVLWLNLSLLFAVLGGCAGQRYTNVLPTENSKTISVPLVNHQNIVFTAELKVGTPPQVFNVLLDTVGSTWLIAYYCGRGEPCYGHRMFRWTDSTSYSTERVKGMVEFGSGNITGVESLDVQELGGVAIGKQFFLNGRRFHVPSFEDDPFDGVFGLRLGPHSPLNEMARSGVIDKPWLGLYFSAHENVSGEALFGGANQRHYQGSLTFTEAFGDAFQFNIDGGPPGEIQVINEWLGGRRVGGGWYEISCDTGRYFVLIIGRTFFAFAAADYLIKVDEPSGTRCYSSFLDASEMHNASWHLGLVFLRRAYTVLEAPQEPWGHGRVGLARARSAA